MSSGKIIDGLHDAMMHARCDHDFIVTHIEQVLGNIRVTSRCDKCATVTTAYMPGHDVRFVVIERTK